MDINIKYFDDYIPKLEKTPKGDWIDLRVREIMVILNDKKCIQQALDNPVYHAWNKNDTISYSEGKVIFMKLGVAMELPQAQEAEIRPRSSTFKNYGLLLTNSPGTVDNVFRGNDDEWGVMFYATRGDTISKYDRVAQFRIDKNMPEIKFIEKEILTSPNRGSYGTSGTK